MTRGVLESVGIETIHAAEALRHTLHREPDLSKQEAGTARIITGFLGEHGADEILTGLGGTGVAAIYRGAGGGPTVMIRSELDALPIAEVNDFAHRSRHEHVSHKCGHDGHMAMVAGLAPLLRRRAPRRGRVVLLFQPAEETGEGAAAVIDDRRFASIAPDYAFALHNLPGRPLHEIVLRERTFAMASVGMATTLTGRTAHASEPEKGTSPAAALRTLLETLPALGHSRGTEGFALATLTHMKLGERSFGIAPGSAEVLATLRAETDEGLEHLCDRATDLIAHTARASGLEARTSWSERFAATRNDPRAVSEIRAAAERLGLTVQLLDEPMRWSEDFGLFTRNAVGAMLGLGSGTDQPALHSPDYDFPDELLPTGIALFRHLIDQLLD